MDLQHYAEGLCSLTNMPDADHKDLTGKIATCHSRPDTPRRASRKRAFISRSADDEADISSSASVGKENGPILVGRSQRTAVDLPGMLSITAIDTFVYTLVNGYLLSRPEHTICQLLTRACQL